MCARSLSHSHIDQSPFKLQTLKPLCPIKIDYLIFFPSFFFFRVKIA